LRPLDEKTQRRRGQSVVSIVAGPHFGATDLPRRILELGLIHILFSTALLSVCTAPALETNSSQLSIVSFIMNVKLCLAIPKFGIRGAAVATFFTEIVSLALLCAVPRETGVPTRVIQTVPRPFVRGHEKVSTGGQLRSPLVATKRPTGGPEKSPPFIEYPTAVPPDR
jgi:hypothetical protein